MPFTLEVKNNYFNKKLFSKLISKRLDLILKMKFIMDLKINEDLQKFKLINKNTKFQYNIDNNSFVYNSELKDFYKGQLDFKPFYLNKKINYEKF